MRLKHDEYITLEDGEGCDGRLTVLIHDSLDNEDNCCGVFAEAIPELITILQRYVDTGSIEEEL